ncbi:MAG: hypothetical protein PF637_03115 [Spirochaetes bacterium]|jgi:hypothetical protein|nr:hypothetical protein [Spirochaetota bacterium]
MRREGLLRCTGILLFVIVLLFAACGGDDKESDSEDSVQITSDASKMENFPSDAKESEAESFEVNGQDVSGSESTRVDDTDETPGSTSILLPATLSRAGGSVVAFGVWINGTVTETEETEDFNQLIRLLSDVFGDYLDDSIANKIKIDDLPLPLIPGDNYICFYWKDSNGNEYRTPVVAIKYNPGGIDTGDLL